MREATQIIATGKMDTKSATNNYPLKEKCYENK